MDQEEAEKNLREALRPGDTVTTVLRHVARSGMTRWIDLYVIRDGEPRWLSYQAAAVGVGTFDRNRDSIKISGAGMDMGFALVYDLARTLWPDGFECIGERCPANDHANGDRNYTPGHVVHRDGGYALNQRWM